MGKEAIEVVLKKLDMPQVKSWHVETGLDASDDSAVWVWVTLRQEGVESINPL